MVQNMDTQDLGLLGVTVDQTCNHWIYSQCYHCITVHNCYTI